MNFRFHLKKQHIKDTRLFLSFYNASAKINFRVFLQTFYNGFGNGITNGVIFNERIKFMEKIGGSLDPVPKRWIIYFQKDQRPSSPEEINCENFNTVNSG
ncbi:hypothetical protein RF11_13403 [Thelohanellus kitauei]|uniref:Uncharacterized protein n=1 Tax=Thelohanellus kitauei TaxID=669202 RepID=A0A0C2NFS4_THEKT|nr:hypothetical protein RF11_13403 [Thelohanellus kitauei]